MIKLTRGTQVVYVPTHVDGDMEGDVSYLSHPDVQFGFVTSVAKGGAYFCRYWISRTSNELRTKANSESTPASLLMQVDSHTEEEVGTALREYC